MFGDGPVLNENSEVYSVSSSALAQALIFTYFTTDIGMLIALKSWPELGVHVRGAINNGLTELEIREAILQASIYCGVPAGIKATKVAEATLKDMEQKGEFRRQMSELAPPS